MKKIFIIIIALALVTGVSAQGHGFARGGYYRPRTTVIVGGGYAPFYPYLGLYGYPYWGYPMYNNMYMPSRLDMQIENIKHDYSDKISSVRMDESLSGKDRRQKIRDLKKERDNTIDQAKRSYYKS
ncbi:hypothetical protein ACI6Q2_19895 [Chitinophagaceae bacterium LWZ2-11]